MSYYDRNTKYLEQHRIIYRQNPTTDEPTESFDGVGIMRTVHINAIHYLIHGLK